MAVVFTDTYETYPFAGYDLISGSVTQEVAAPIRQAGSMHCDANSEAQYVLKGTTANAIAVYSVFFRLDALDGTGTIFYAYNAADTSHVQLLLTKGTPNTLTMQGDPGALSAKVATINPVVGTLYRVDIRINASANPWVVDWGVATGYGAATAQTASQPAFAASTIAYTIVGLLGAGISGTNTIGVFDDLQIATGSSGDYPLAYSSPSAGGSHTLLLLGAG